MAVPSSGRGHLAGVLAGLDPVLRRACDRRLSVIVDWHNFAGLSDHPDCHRQEFVAGWRVIAEHFAGWPPSLWFELLNEPSNNLSGDLLNRIDAYNRMPAGRNPSSALAFASLLADAAEWSAHFGRPVHIGEFGAFQTLDPASRDRYARAFRIAAEHRRIPWCWWEWKAGFGDWNPAKNKALLGQALFGKSKNERRIKAPLLPARRNTDLPKH